MVKGRKFGTFGGVFTPSILTILGVIMYMRLPMIVGEAGLFGTLGIILVAHLISVTTGLSVSSIATDKKVKEGGTYYIISRSLGLPIGGTLGLALFVGLSFSVSLYLIGFSESFLGILNLPVDRDSIRITGTIILIIVTIITFISTSLAIKTQYLIMAAIVLSLLSVLLGRHEMPAGAPNLFGRGSGISLMVLFGIYFPAVTGFEAGVSMSGDLRDPKKSIPLGTISAIAIGLIVYIGLAFFFSFRVNGELLATDPKVLFKIALVPQLVIAGIWGATLSSALGSILAAPRILQSTAIDRITSRIFAHGTGASKEPRNALILTFFIAEAGILIGELNVIARIVSIFFITTYGFLNLSAAFESITSADFRPSFKSPPWVSIIGSLACFFVMIQLDFLAMIGAVVILSSLFLFLKQRQLVLETGDTWSSVWASLVRTGLQRLNRSSIHTRNWRPNIILFSGQDTARPHLIELADSISGKLGMYSAFEMIESKESRLARDKSYLTAYGEKKKEFVIHQHKCREIYEGISEISRVYGFSGIEPDTILMGWSKHINNKERFLNTIRNFEESNFNSIFLNYNPQKQFGEKRNIDVWWNGWGSNLTFSIFLLRHLTSGGDWKDAHIRLLVINNNPDRTESVHRTLAGILNRYRIDFQIKIIANSVENLPKDEIIIRESVDTDLTLIGVTDKQYSHLDQIYDEVDYFSRHLGSFLIINSSSRFESFDLLLEPDRNIALIKSDKEYIKLPEIIPSKYSAINDDIKKIDINGQKVLRLFFEKAFKPAFAELKFIPEELANIIKTPYNQLVKLKEIRDNYLSRKIIIKLKNDFYYRVNQIFEDLINKKLIIQKEVLADGIKWYIEQLEKDLSGFPSKLTIPFDREDLLLRRKDPFALKLFILRKRIAHPFARHTISGRIHYYEIASYYLRDNRHNFLSAFLKKFQTEILEPITTLRKVVFNVDNSLDTLLAKSAGNDEIKKEKKEIERLIGEFRSGIEITQENSKNRLMLEFRKNLQLMSNDMGKVDINFRIRRKRRNKNYYADLIRANSNFSEIWYEKVNLFVSKIHFEVNLQAFKSRIKDKINEFYLKVDQQLDHLFRMELQQLRSNLEHYDNYETLLKSIKTKSLTSEDNITLLKDFNQLGKEILQLTEILPENITIPGSIDLTTIHEKVEEHIDVDLRRITRFYIESKFIGTTLDKLNKIMDSLKNSAFIVNDILSVVRFNFENIPDDLEDKRIVIDKIIREASTQIYKEEDKIDVVRNNIFDLIDSSLDEVFDKLSGYKLSSTVSEYSWFIREHKGKEAKKKIDAIFEYTRHFFKNIVLRVLYSRSEWVLLAKKISESELKTGENYRILDLIESLNPKEHITDRLPQYYKKLFSGRSSIGEDFWIKRNTDEDLFRKAVLRINTDYKGGILISERNSGKTTFCRYITGKIFRKQKIYNIFPIYNGSVEVSDFIAEISKITQTEGNINEIMNVQAPGSVFIVHDLELWWERSTNGCEVIKLLINLIKEYGNRYIFVVNMNLFAYGLINKLINLQEVFISIIHLKPFDSKDIQEMIMRRHRSSGLKFYLNNRMEDELSEIRVAGLFHKYFNFSEGNPGTALLAWYVNIDKIADGGISIRNPELPDTKVLAGLDDEWKTLLIQFILHKRLTLTRLERIYSRDDRRERGILNALLRTGIVQERNEGLFIINPYIEPHLIKVLKSEDLL
jgi:amino acid transporter